MAHSKIDNTFNGAMDKLKELSSVFREGGKLEDACGDDCDLGSVRSAFEKLMGEMREAHTEATMEESVDEAEGSIPYRDIPERLPDGRLNPDHPFNYGKRPGDNRTIPEPKFKSRPQPINSKTRPQPLGMRPESVEETGMGAPDYNPSRGEYDSNREYGMFSDEGNAEVAEIVDDIVKRHERGEFDSPERAIDAAMNDLMNLSDDQPDFGEASDTDVRDQVARDLEMRIGRDSGFGEANEELDYLRKLAGM